MSNRPHYENTKAGQKIKAEPILKRIGKHKNVFSVMNKSEAILLYLFTVVSKQVKNIVLVHMKQSTQKMHQNWFLFQIISMPIVQYFQSKQKHTVKLFAQCSISYCLDDAQKAVCLNI